LLAGSVRADTIVIGLAGPMTGPVASFGEQMKRGAQLAEENLTIGGKKIVVQIEDDACDPKQATSVANRFAANQVQFVVGHWCAAASLAASKVYGEENIVMLDPGALLSSITQQGLKTIFRFSATDKIYSKAMAGYVKSLKPKNVLILSDRRAVTADMAKYAKQELQGASGIEKVSSEEYQQDTRDFSAVVSRIKVENPDVVFCSCYTLEGGLLIRQAIEQGVTAQFVGMDTFASTDLINIIGNENANAVHVIDYLKPDLMEFNKLMASHRYPKDTHTYTTYAAFQILTQAITTENANNPSVVADRLHAGSFKTLYGDVAFTANGDNVRPQFAIFKWVNKEMKQIDKVLY
jgi:branched-chain amino acid transport system substrate-binding protein